MLVSVCVFFCPVFWTDVGPNLGGGVCLGSLDSSRRTPAVELLHGACRAQPVPLGPSPAVPRKVGAQRRPEGRDAVAVAAPASEARRATVHGPLGHGALGAHAGHDAVEVGLDDDAADDHLAQRGVHGLEVEDEVELADVFKEAVQRLDVDLDEVDEGQRRLGRRRDDDEVERRVVAVGHERRPVGGVGGVGG